MNFKKGWHDFVCFIKLIKADHKNIVWILLLGSLTNSAQPFVHLVFFSRILNKVFAGLYRECSMDVIILLVSTLILSLIAKACSQSVIVLRDACTDSVYFQTANKAYTMEYEEFEKTETMDAIRRVKSGELSTGSIDTQVQSIYILMDKAFSILFASVFVGLLFTQVRQGSRNFFISTWSSLLIIVVLLLIIVFGIRISNKSYKQFYEYGRKNEHFNSLGIYMLNLMNHYQYGKDIRINSMQGLLENYYHSVMKKINNFYLKWGIKEGFYTGMIMFFTQLASGLVYIILGGKAIYGVINTGDVLMYAGAVLLLSNSIREEIIEYNSFHYRAEYLKRYYEFINKPNTHYTGTLPVEKRSDVQYEFELENVSFGYPGTGELIIKNMNLKINIGEKYAIVGRNGAGKTTLIKLLCRLYDPTQGRILLNGVDIRYYDYTEYSNIFSVVFQDFKLLSLPLEDNISAGGEMDEKRMWEVLSQAGMKERIEAMPRKLQTQLYKNNGSGIEISGGEAQKLAIARALYKDGPFIILDEPTAALDPISEAEIYENFNHMIQGKTAIYISHRMSSCKFCDNIIVLDGGIIKERGNHEKLLKENGIYASLFRAQAQYYTA
jgi:ABC-type multidrug transport system, ATPase and permease components